jgi:hypothetical protein
MFTPGSLLPFFYLAHKVWASCGKRGFSGGAVWEAGGWVLVLSVAGSSGYAQRCWTNCVRVCTLGETLGIKVVKTGVHCVYRPKLVCWLTLSTALFAQNGRCYARRSRTVVSLESLS